MGRNRKKAYQQLPKYVYFNRNRFVFRPPGCKDVVIGSGSMPLSEVWQRHKELTGQAKTTLKFLVESYLDSDQFNSLKSKRHIENNLRRLLETPVGGKVFGDVNYNNITPGTIRKYLDYRGNTSANREVAALSSVWMWCRERDMVGDNPCKGVRKIKEKPRTRYVTDEEYKTVYDNAPSYVQVAMELAYLCRMRIGEVLDTRVKDIEALGLNTRRSKGSNSTLTTWTVRLENAVNEGLKGCMRVPDMPIVNVKGSPVKYDAFYKEFKKANTLDFNFHDLKAKGVSDFEGDKKAASGHKSEAMVNLYDRKRKSVEATE